MSRLHFVLLTTLGSGAWNAAFVLAGYALAARFQQVERYSIWIDGAVYAALAVLVALGVRRALQRRQDA